MTTKTKLKVKTISELKAEVESWKKLFLEHSVEGREETAQKCLELALAAWGELQTRQ